jgi:hypothetical protein
MRLLALAALAAALTVGVACVESTQGRLRLVERSPRGTCSRGSGRGSTSMTRSSMPAERGGIAAGGSRRADGLGRDGERPLADGRRRPGGARPARRLAPRTASAWSAGTSRVTTTTRETSAARGRCSRSARRGGTLDGVALDVESLQQRERAAANLATARSPHPPSVGGGSTPIAAITHPPAPSSGTCHGGRAFRGRRSRSRWTRSCRCCTRAEASRATTRPTATWRAPSACCGRRSAPMWPSTQQAASPTG